jgi:hypothetical protein
MTVPCPLCDQFSGKPESVRAHISAKQDDQHRGETGFDYDDQLGLGTEQETNSSPEQDSEPAKQTSSEQSDSVQIRSVERDQTDDGIPVMKLVLTGAALEGISRAMTGDGLIGEDGLVGTVQGGSDDRDRM